MTDKKRVLIMSASAGTGHGRAGDALAKVFAADPRVGDVVHRDALKFTNKLFRDFYSTLYTKLVRDAPDFLGWWYNSSDEPWKTDATRLALDRLNTGPLVKFVQKFRPDILVCTHFMPAGVLSHLISRKALDAHLSIVVTDFDFHAMWLSRAFHRYFVALEETRAHLEALGLPGDRVTVSGIPIDPCFAEPLSDEKRWALREEFGLAAEGRTTLLLSGGALGVGPAEFVVRRLLQLRHLPDVQTLVVCGKDAALRTQVEALVAKEAGDAARQFRVIGYSDRMHELMRLSDLYIGKPGGLTTSEAMACSLPLLIVSPIPGQEERNSDHLLEAGVALKCNDLTVLPFKLDRLLDDPARLREMRARTAALARPDAAQVVVRTLLDEKSRVTSLHEIDSAERKAIAEVAEQT